MKKGLGLGTYLHKIVNDGKDFDRQPVCEVYDTDKYELVHYSESSSIGRTLFIKYMGYADTQEGLCSIFMERDKLREVLKDLEKTLDKSSNFYNEVIIMIAKLGDVEEDCLILVSYDN